MDDGAAARYTVADAYLDGYDDGYAQRVSTVNWVSLGLGAVSSAIVVLAVIALWWGGC
jgi:hypothetical protein